jgi:hypothetical protein
MDKNKNKEDKVLKFPSGQNIKAQTPEEEIYDIAYDIGLELGFDANAGISGDVLLMDFAKQFNELVKTSIYMGFTANVERPAAYTVGALVQLSFYMDKDEFEKVRHFVNSKFNGIKLVDFYKILDTCHNELMANKEKEEETKGEENE